MAAYGSVVWRRGRYYRQGKLGQYLLYRYSDSSGQTTHFDERCRYCRQKEPHSQEVCVYAVAETWNQYKQVG